MERAHSSSSKNVIRTRPGALLSTEDERNCQPRAWLLERTRPAFAAYSLGDKTSTCMKPFSLVGTKRLPVLGSKPMVLAQAFVVIS